MRIDANSHTVVCLLHAFILGWVSFLVFHWGARVDVRCVRVRLRVGFRRFQAVFLFWVWLV